MIIKYTVIAKVEAGKVVKYHSDDLVNFTRFLDRRFPKWCWFNVFLPTGEQVASYTNRNKPTSKQVTMV